MVMSGRINKGIVRMLQENGINAVGLSGVDARTIQAQRKKRLLIVNERGRRQAIDGGYTGKITQVNAEFIRSLLGMGLTPVISPIAISEESEFLNVDGDRAAAYVAGSVKADRVLFITNVDGLMMDDRLVTDLSLAQAREIRPKNRPRHGEEDPCGNRGPGHGGHRGDNSKRPEGKPHIVCHCARHMHGDQE